MISAMSKMDTIFMAEDEEALRQLRALPEFLLETWLSGLKSEGLVRPDALFKDIPEHLLPKGLGRMYEGWKNGAFEPSWEKGQKDDRLPVGVGSGPGAPPVLDLGLSPAPVVPDTPSPAGNPLTSGPDKPQTYEGWRGGGFYYPDQPTTTVPDPDKFPAASPDPGYTEKTISGSVPLMDRERAILWAAENEEINEQIATIKESGVWDVTDVAELRELQQEVREKSAALEKEQKEQKEMWQEMVDRFNDDYSED